MNRGAKLKLNIITSVAYQVVVLACGMILPRYYLLFFGSNVNGLVSSIKQFLGFISILELGMGAVVQTALYKPLAEKDNDQISRIYIKAQSFFRRIAYVFCLYIIVLCIVYPLLQNEFDALFIILLILIISISSFAQYFFAVVNQLLIGADQIVYISNCASIISYMANTLICILLITHGFSLLFVLLASSIVFVIRPLFLNWYVAKNYHINKKIQILTDPIPGKGSAFVHHFSFFVLQQTDVALLTVFTDFALVSVYSVYSMVITGLKNLVITTLDGIQSLYGNMAAKGELKELSETFAYYEWMFHCVVTFLFGCCAFLIVPFVSVYTADITDAEYLRLSFGYLMSLAGAGFIYRQIYYMPVKVFGKYKETQMCAIVEMVTNIIVSIVLLNLIGINGVAVGTVIAVFFKVIYLIFYLPRLFSYSKLRTLKYFTLDLVIIGVFFLLSHIIPVSCTGYAQWFMYALATALVFGAILVCVNFIVFNEYSKRILRGIVLRGRK